MRETGGPEIKMAYICTVCGETEEKCQCPRFCILCSADHDVRLCDDGCYYCGDCREICGYIAEERTTDYS